MKNTTKSWAVISMVTLGLTFFVFGALAQETKKAPASNKPTISMSDPIPGTVNCFDYYKFGSVQVDVSSEIGSTVPGVPMSFQAEIKNANDYPIIEGAVYVKVFRKQTNQKNIQANGHDLVDQFFIAENISLNAKENKKISFDWKIPSYAMSGEYQIATFFTSGKKFNLLGLSFTDDIVGNTFNFKVVSDGIGNVEFQKNKVMMNDQDYHFAAFTPKFGKDEQVTIKTILENTTKEIQKIPVIWTLYSWDGQRVENVIDVKQDQVEIAPGKTQEVSYQITDTDKPVYYIVAEARFEDAKSILDMRFSRNDVNKVRINFPSVTDYPLQKDRKETLFVCVHNSGTADMVENNKLVVTVLDTDKNEIHRYTYEGKISGAMMGFKDEFISKENLDSFFVKVDLFTDGQQVDGAIMKYDCEQLNPGKCTDRSSVKTGEFVGIDMKKTGIVIVSLLLFVSLISILVWKKSSGGMSVFLLSVVISGALLFGGREAEAKSVTWSLNKGIADTGEIIGKYSYIYMINLNTIVSGTYNAQVRNVDTGAIMLDGSIVPVGTRLSFEALPFSDQDISWFMSGGVTDSPYGRWVSGAGSPTIYFRETENKIFITYWNSSSALPPYGTVSFNPPTVSVLQNGTAGMNCSGGVCVVTSPGTIQASIGFGPTFGYVYVGNEGANGSIGPNDKVDMVRLAGSEGMSSDGTGNTGGNSRMAVPAQYIPFFMTAVASNNRPPTPPTIIGPSEGSRNTNYSFNFLSTDPENDTLRYGIDWNRDNSIDQWLPAATYVASGVSQDTIRQWLTTGAKTFQALAQDSKGGLSAWREHKIVISNACVPDTTCLSHAPSWTGQCNGVCGQGMEIGTCDNGCGGTGATVRSCSLLSCASNRDYWKEVAP